jgi:Ca2+-dependent lipid-binding protein
LRPTGTLDVKLVEARNLKNTDFIGKSDPFAILFVRPIPSRMEKSKVISNNLNPIWNESFKLVVEDPDTQRLMIKVGT